MATLLCVGGPVAFSQTGENPDLLKNRKGKIAFARLRPDQVKPLKEAPAFLRTFLDMRPGHEFRLKRERTNRNGITHQRYDQYFQGVKIEGAEYLVHSRNGVIQTINGGIENISVPSVTPNITKEQAISRALTAVPAKIYGWQNSFAEARYKTVTGNPAATLYPKPELVIAFDDKAHAHRLIYKVHVYAVEPFADYNVYIDAITGGVVDKINLTCTVNTPGTGPTLYSGTQNITVDSWLQQFRLFETRSSNAGSANIHTWNMQNGGNYSSAVEFTNNTPNWQFSDAALDVHWGTERVYDFFAQVFGRNSYNGSGGELKSYVHAWLPAISNRYTNNDNAFWDGSLHSMTYGDGTFAFTSVTSLDVIAHEIGHGFHQTELGSNSTGNDGSAINEGLSDIWGACIEHWAAPTKNTWQIGEEIMNNGWPCLRSLENPGIGFPGGSGTGVYADTYMAGNWNTNPAVNTYNNATVLGYWFYLLSAGGSGTNDLGNAFNVQGLTIEQAQRIVYEMEIDYLVPNATFPDVRNASILATRELFGEFSCQEKAVTDAWFAVGVGPAYITPWTTASISGPAVICQGSSKTYTLVNAPNIAYTWTTSNINTTLVPSADGFSAVATHNGAGISASDITVTHAGCPGVSVFQVSKTVEHGPPGAIGIGSFSNATICPEADGYFRFQSGGPTNNQYGMSLQVSANRATSYSWSELSSNSKIFWEVAGNGLVYVSSKQQNVGMLTLRCTASNECGPSTRTYTFISPGNTPCPVARMAVNEDVPANISENKLAVYPNPVKDNLSITLPNTLVTGRASIHITDVYGRQVKRVTNVSVTNTISMSEFSAGIYIVEVFAENKLVLTKKILKQ